MPPPAIGHALAVADSSTNVTSELMQSGMQLPTPEQADACMNSTAHDADINKGVSDATARYNPTGTPTFIIDYKKSNVPPGDWDAMQAAIDAALAAKHAK